MSIVDKRFEIVEAIIQNLSDRKGFDLGELHEDVQEEIRETWEEIVKKILEK